MGEALITWGIIISIIIGLRYFFKKKKGYRRQYSLGLIAAEEVQKLIKNKAYSEAEKKIQNQSLNDITQIIDHLSLSLNEDELLKWDESENSDISKLTLGVFYLHLAWITRSHKLAKDVSQKDAEGFYDYLDLCEKTFESISADSFYRPELESRNIRLYMSLGDNSIASYFFDTVTKKHPDFIWPYIHYAELIQPKWGGAIEDLERFYESLPDNFLIRSIVELKLILDSNIMSDNYFVKYNNNINEFARQKVIKIDAELNLNSVSSIHKYILYNYMVAISEDLKLNDLSKKYQKLVDGKYTIYPYGLVN
ncbi:MAG: hypothetical protein J7604_24970 [Sporocytophaga sp.]|uniref:hypothetical protein n=1 Tax=Sporocytophaga sp. TaxID=2231183 RepID=UPI001B28AFF8|nr:hypothetical protein [Sporocytophaga sp.]MBO9703484.1 hypothetical protein [Sporocytophaga sp.]